MGFGASLTESSGYVISTLPQEDRTALLQALFDPEMGLGLNLLRQPMGSPDFALSMYTYDDLPEGEEDFSLSLFSIDRDRRFIIPYLKEALGVNPDLLIMASPWSPPAWMKTGRGLISSEGGRLREDCYEVYARYFVKFIQAYEEEGIPIYAITPQNEILYAPPAYPGMLMSADEQARFISEALGPALRAAGLDVRIFCYDHNWDGKDVVLEILRHSEVLRFVSGVAWHHYGGTPSAMKEVHEVFPELEMWVTEAGSGRWIGRGTFSATFREGMREAIEIFRNQASALILWNIALDQHNGPIVFENTANHGLVEIVVDPESRRGRISEPYRSGWYVLGHFSRFVKRGSYRIESNTLAGSVGHVAFITPSDEIVVVVHNPFFSAQRGVVRIDRRVVYLELPSGAAATVVVR